MASRNDLQITPAYDDYKYGSKSKSYVIFCGYSKQSTLFCFLSVKSCLFQLISIPTMGENNTEKQMEYAR